MSLANFRHPVPWIIAVAFGVTAVQYLMYIGFMKLGWDGPAQVIHPSHA